MTIRFLVDYRGWLTGEAFYTAGSVADLPETSARRLVGDGRAETAEPPPEAPQEAPQEAPPDKPKPRRAKRK